jgi:hypothetical protein
LTAEAAIVTVLAAVHGSFAASNAGRYEIHSEIAWRSARSAARLARGAISLARGAISGFARRSPPFHAE